MEDSNRVSTGVPGLDTILGGGLPGPRLYLLRGAAGTGKTTLALQFLMEGVRQGEAVLYVSLAQSEDELRQMAASHGWSLDGIAIVSLAGEDPTDMTEQTIFQSADLRLDRTRDTIQNIVKDIQPRRVVYDSLLEVRLLAADAMRLRREILGFKSFLGTQGVTTLLLDTEHLSSADTGAEDQLENIAHGLIRLERQLPAYGIARRRVEVKKMRGTPINDGYHDLSIRQGEGVTIYPRIVPNTRHEEGIDGELIKCNIENLDGMLGGGLDAGTTALLMGQSGTGKSTLASLYIRAALERGERVGMFLFEERQETFFRRSEGLGIKLREYYDAGQLMLRDFNPTEVSPGEFAGIVRESVEEHNARVIAIDSFTGYLSALPESQEAITQMHSLLKYITRRGVLTMLIVAQHGLLGYEAHTDLDMSFLGDSVLLLRMFEWPGVVRRTITVVKKRHGPHDLDVHEYIIGSEGVKVEPFNQPPPGESGGYYPKG
ncbi:ATPase domain-containing protein [Consotaella aegiceratis]|uniref:ATPase domain-containing protein n=1 Tax=Consotaella aegiceratis TaxID=3097961 RepID=UPI002F401F92